RAYTDCAHLTRLFALVGQAVFTPINIFGDKFRRITLGGADLPEHLVVMPSLSILLSSDNPLVFFTRNRPLRIGLYFWPEFLLNNRPRQPTKTDSEIMQTAHGLLGVHTSGSEHGSEVIGCGFNKTSESQRDEGRTL